MIQIPFIVGENTYYVMSDDKQYTIGEYKMVKFPQMEKAESILQPFKYFATLDGAIHCALNMKVRASDAKSFQELQDVIMKCTKEFTDIYRVEIKKEK